MAPTASVIVRCCNEGGHIGKLLTGIFSQTLKDVEVIVVDSGSTDDTLAIAARFPVRVLHIRREEFSFGRSLNLGCEAATGEYLVIASAHVFPVYHDWLERLLEPFADPGVALSYGRQLGGDATRYSEHQVFAKWFPPTGGGRQEHPFCNNANAAIRRELFGKFRYDEELTGLEDLDWALRVMNEGWGVAYAPRAEIVHLHNERWLQVMNRYRREAMALKGIVPGQRFGLGGFFWLFASNFLSDLANALRDRVNPLSYHEIALFRLMQFWGSYRGFNSHSPVTGALRERFYYPRGVARHAESGGEERRPIAYADKHHAKADGARP